jgi:alpha-mannosidase
MPDKTVNSPQWELFVVPGSHVDLSLCSDSAECLAYADSIIMTAIDAIVGDYPDYKFTVEYTLFMEHFLKRFPKYAETVSRLIRENRLEVCATFVDSMEQTLDGELLIRTIIEGCRYVSETFGVKPVTAHHTDFPGHAWQMPQILAMAGIKYMTSSRFHLPHVLFRRSAPDGSVVILSSNDHHYNWGHQLRHGVEHCVEHLPSKVEEIAQRSPVRQILMTEEHYLDLPDPSILEVVNALNSRDLSFKLRIATITEFFKSLDTNVDLPEYSGEAPYSFYTAPALEPDIYLKTREAESMLATAEKLSTMRHLYDLGSYPREELREGWRALFYPRDHNFTGRHGRDNAERRLNKIFNAFDIGKSITREAKIAFAVNIKHRCEGFPILIFNPCSWPRTDIVEASAEFDTLEDCGVVVRDGEGYEIPCQVIAVDRARDNRYDFRSSERSQFRFLFIARDVPPLGYKTYYVTPCSEPRIYPSSIVTSDANMRNASIAFRFADRAIFYGPGSREITNTDRYLFAEPVVFEYRHDDLDNAIDIEEQREKEPWSDASPHWRLEKETLTGREWRASDQSICIDVVESGPVRASVRFSGTAKDSPFEQMFSIYEDMECIDLRTVVHWQGSIDTILTLPMTFSTGDDSEITYESPFTAVRLEKDELENFYRGIGGRLVQKWVDIGNKDFGITIATASGSHFLRDNMINPILLKSGYSKGDAFHIMLNKGTWEFRHRIVPHEGSWREAKSYRHGLEHWTPMLDAHFHPPLRTLPNNKQLPDVASFLEVIAENVVVSAVKKSDLVDNRFIIRVYDAEGVPNPKVRIRFAFTPKSVQKVDLLEEPLSEVKLINNVICFPMRRWEIATLAVEF